MKTTQMLISRSVFKIKGQIKFENSSSSAISDFKSAAHFYNLAGFEETAQELILKYSLQD